VVAWYCTVAAQCYIVVAQCYIIGAVLYGVGTWLNCGASFPCHHFFLHPIGV
jgi:hypothetical protein